MRVERKGRLLRNGLHRRSSRRSSRALLWPTGRVLQMNYTVVMIPSAMQTRVLVSHGPDELMRARLPPPSQVRHRRAVISWLEGMSWDIGEDLEHPSHREGLLQRKPRAAAQALPGLLGLEDTGTSYFKIFAASGRSIHRETIRLTFLVELFGEHATRAAISEVMATGHVGSEYVEYVLRNVVARLRP
jgi:hypothetical protein